MLKKILRSILQFTSYEDRIYKLYCKSHRFHQKKAKNIVDYYNYRMYKKYNCMISGRAILKSKLILPHPIGIVIGGGFQNDTTIIGNNVTIYQNVTIGQKKYLYPHIGDNVVIYSGAVIIGNINIGNNVVIGANAVVTHDVPDNSVVAGIPAKIIKRNDQQ